MCVALSCSGAVVAPEQPRGPPAGVLADVSVDLSRPGRTIPESFFGLGFEYDDILNYTGREPARPNGAFVQLVTNIETAAGGPLVFRIGGNSTDDSWWNPDGAPRPSRITYDIDRAWLATVGAAVAATHARLIVGINLRLNDSTQGARWAQAAQSGLRDSVVAFEIGNEPNFFGAGRKARPATYGFDQYQREYEQYASTLRAAVGARVRLAGPAILTPRWMSNLPGYLRAEAGRLDLVTYHQYPLSACGKKPGDADYPTIAELLSNQASHGVAVEVLPFVRQSAAAGLPLRVDEMNSVVCFGAPGVSDTFASALWMADVLFEYAAAGVAGVNVQTITNAHYTPFVVTPGVRVNPGYYGLLLATRAMPSGAALLRTEGTVDGNAKVWATIDATGTIRVVVLDKNAGGTGDVVVRLPRCGSAGLTRLEAPALASEDRATLGGETFDGTTDGNPRRVNATARVEPAADGYRFPLSGPGGALLTVRGCQRSGD